MAFVTNVFKWLNWLLWTVRLCIKRNLLFRFRVKHLSTLPANTTLTQCWSNAGPQSAMLAQNQTSTGSTPRACWAAFNYSVKTKHLYSICTTLYKCYTNVLCFLGITASLVLLTAGGDYKPTLTECWASVAGAGQYPFSPSQYSCCPYLHAGGRRTLL